MVNMGLGTIGNAGIIHKRKFRWTFAVDGPCDIKVKESFVKLASRPNLSIEETEINYLNGKTWIPGKGTWETITITYYDVAGENIGLWSWLASVYDFASDNAPVALKQATARQDYSGTCTLTMYDGCGVPIESWTLSDAWPQAMNFGDLDYSSSEEATIEVTLRYAQVQYKNFCGQDPINCCETHCQQATA